MPSLGTRSTGFRPIDRDMQRRLAISNAKTRALRGSVARAFGKIADAGDIQFAMGMFQGANQKRRADKFQRWLKSVPLQIQQIVSRAVANATLNEFKARMHKPGTKPNISKATQEIADLRARAQGKVPSRVTLPRGKRTSSRPLIRQAFGKRPNRSLIESFKVLRSGRTRFFVGIPGDLVHPSGMRTAVLARMHETGFVTRPARFDDATGQDNMEKFFGALQANVGTPRHQRRGRGVEEIRVPARPMLPFMEEVLKGRKLPRLVQGLIGESALDIAMSTGGDDLIQKLTFTNNPYVNVRALVEQQARRREFVEGIVDELGKDANKFCDELIADVQKSAKVGKKVKTKTKKGKKGKVEGSATVFQITDNSPGGRFFNSVMRHMFRMGVGGRR